MTKRERERVIRAAESVDGGVSFYTCCDVANVGKDLCARYEYMFGFDDSRCITENERTLWYVMTADERKEVRVLMLLLFAETGGL